MSHKAITREQIVQLAKEYNLPAPLLLAVYKVEAAGKGFLPDGRPKILFERHKFAKHTGGIYNVSYPDISNPTWGGYRGGAGEYARFDKAQKINRNAAIKACSWGAGQVLGEHYKMLGFATPQEMLNAAFESEYKQFKMMLDYIKSRPNLIAAIKKSPPDWDAFALGYNGSKYRENKYDDKLAAAYEQFSRIA